VMVVSTPMSKSCFAKNAYKIYTRPACNLVHDLAMILFQLLCANVVNAFIAGKRFCSRLDNQ